MDNELCDDDKRALIMELRHRTKYPFLECKKALETCLWDFQKAVSYLRAKLDESKRRFGGILDG